MQLENEASAPVGPQVIFGFDAEGVCTLSVGPGLPAIGYQPNQLVGTNLLELYAGDERLIASLHRALRGETFVVESEFGSRLLWTFFQPLFDDDGVMTGAVGVTTDTTRQHETERELQLTRERARKLADLSVSLTREVLDLDSLLAVAVRALTGLIGDYGAIWLCNPEGTAVEPRAVWHDDPQQQAALSAFTRRIMGRPGWLDVPTIEAMDEPQLVRWADVERGLADNPDLLQDIVHLGLHSLLRLPLRSRGRTLGLIGVARGSGHEAFTPADLSVAGDVAERVALAVDNALLLSAERAAHEDLLKFRALADASPLLIALSDPNGTPTYASPQVTAMGVSWTAGDIWTTVAQNAGPEVMASMQAAVALGQPWASDISLPDVAGGMVVSADVFPLHHPDSGEHLGLAFIAQDVTRLRSAEAALRATNADLKRFQALVEASSDFIAIAALDGTVGYINPAGRALIGLGPDDDVTTTRIGDYLPADHLAISLEQERPAVLEHGHWEGESALADKRGGPPIPVAVASFLIPDLETGQPFALATVRRDITERLATDTELRQLAEQRQALLTRLVEAQESERAQIADDIHDDSVQALAAVGLRLGLLRRQLAEHAPALLDSLEPVQTSVAEATARLRSLLFDLEPPDLSRGLAGAIHNAAAGLFGETGTAWEVSDGDEPDAPDTTRSIAYRIAREALINVRKHAEASRVVVTIGGTPTRLEVEVADDGCGLTVAAQRRAPGHRGVASMQDRAAIAGGECHVEAGLETGTVVRFWLPVTPVASADGSGQVVAPAHAQG